MIKSIFIINIPFEFLVVLLLLTDLEDQYKVKASQLSYTLYASRK